MTFRLGIDVGGTFTDFLLLDGDGTAALYKTSTTPEDPATGLMNGLVEMAAERNVVLADFVRAIDVIVHGTTVATNAVLTGSGAATALLTTEGFRDALEMRRGIREAQYDNHYTAPPPLVPRHRRLTARERIDYCGTARTALRTEDVLGAAARFREAGVEAVAVSFMHAYANPAHEAEAAQLLRRELPDVYLAVSSEVLPQIRFYDRTSTTVLNAYVGPLIQRYLESLTGRLDKLGFRGVLLIMQSNGGVTSPEVATRLAASTLLSGPAAGPVAGLMFVEPHGSSDCITIDMGGTSFDTALIVDRAPRMVTDGRIKGHLLALPSLDIHTIGAGGGSIGWVDAGGFLRMGPQSAGAVPGPACYGRGGERPTSTDADLILGYLAPDYFLGGKLRLDPDQAKTAIERYVAQPLGLSVEEAAVGMFTVLNNNMVNGIREISVQRGYDPREFPLVVAGGAGPIHSAVIASELGSPALIIPRASSVFCAAGMLFSDIKHDFVRAYPTTLATLDAHRFWALCGQMRGEACATLSAEAVAPERQRLAFSVDLRSQGQFHEVNVPLAEAEIETLDLEAVAARFHAEHDRLYGYSVPGAPLELVAVRLAAVGITNKPRLPSLQRRPPNSDHAARGRRPVYLPGTQRFEEVPVYDGDRLTFGNWVSGPAIIEQVTTTVFVPKEYEVECDVLGSFVMVPKDPAARC
ncbi:MAG TPA: 5-oxoprolinase [Chloroflexi bacterium]|nr:5-oxoprolinase [Chloroflexota bacterium]